MTIEATLHRAHGALTTLNNGRHAWLSDVNKTLGSGDQAPDPHDLLDSALAEAARTAAVYKEQWFSDHAPLTIDYDFTL